MWIPRWIELAIQDIASHLGAIRKSLDEQANANSNEQPTDREDEREKTGVLRSIAQNIEAGNSSATTAHQENQRQQGELISAQWLLVWFTAGAFVAAGIYAAIAAFQLGQMIEATKQAKRSADVAACALKENQRQFALTSKSNQAQFEETLRQMQTQTRAQLNAAKASQDGATAATSAATTAKSALTISQRAYVAIGRKDGVVAEFVASKDHPDENVPLVVYFQNTGHIPALIAWDTTDPRKDGKLASLGIHLFSTGKGGIPLTASWIDKKTGMAYESESRDIAGESMRKIEMAYISQSDLEELSKKIVGFYIDGYYAYCDGLGTWSTHQFTLNYHSDIPSELRFSLVGDIPIANAPIPKSVGDKLYFPPCTATIVMAQTQQYARQKAKK